MKLRTWHVETVVVAVPLLVVTATHGWRLADLLGTGAVILSFGHASISDRLAEKERLAESAKHLFGDVYRSLPSVECHKHLHHYWIGKEIAWASAFIASRNWTALIGCAVFLVHPVWRRWYRTRYPAMRSQEET